MESVLACWQKSGVGVGAKYCIILTVLFQCELSWIHFLKHKESKCYVLHMYPYSHERYTYCIRQSGNSLLGIGLQTLDYLIWEFLARVMNQGVVEYAFEINARVCQMRTVLYPLGIAES